MPVQEPGDPGGKVRRWVNRSLLFLDRGVFLYGRILAQSGYTSRDMDRFRAAMTAFVAGTEPDDDEFCLSLEVLGALSAWFADNSATSSSTDVGVVSFLYESLMDGEIGIGATTGSGTEYAAVSGF